MSFSSQMKEELTRLPADKACCSKAELSGLMMGAGSIKLSSLGVQAELSTESSLVARKAFSLVKELYSVHATIERHERRRLNRNYSYRVLVDGEQARKMLEETGMLGGKPVPKKLLRRNCCKSAFLRGLFLGCGTIANPEKSYQAEFVLSDEARASAVRDLLENCGIAAKTAARGEKYVVYMKLGEQITALMALTGAHATLLDYENVRAMKDLRNNVNRIVNCEAANLGKLSNAVARQCMCIEKLMQQDRFHLLDEELQMTAYARLDNPEATLRELADILGISKSGVSHRLIRIEEMANDLAE